MYAMRSKRYIIKNQVKFKDATDEEIDQYCNGCGSKGAIFKVPDFLFRASCNHHDWNYMLARNSNERLKADDQFLEAMLEDADGSIIYKSWAYIYYYAVRAFGRFNIEYDKSKLIRQSK